MPEVLTSIFSSRPIGRARRRPAIALLTQYLDRSDGGYEYTLRRAFAAACRRHNFDLVVICGEALDDPRAEYLPKNRIYQLVDRDGFDGVIYLTAGLASYCGVERMSQHLAHLNCLAQCSVGTTLAGIPSVIADNRTGITQLVEHVILRHNRKHLAFLGAFWDNEEIDQRKDAVLLTCERLGVPVDAQRILVAGLESVTAEAAAAQLLACDNEVDAIICANDGSAVGVVRAVEKWGPEVAARIIVTGYDDIPLAQLLARPLSTVRQPLAELAEAAVQVIAQQLRGLTVPLITALPTQLVLRASCGCEWGGTKGAAEGTELAESERQCAATPCQAWTDAAFNLRNRLIERIDIETMYVQILEIANRFSRSLDLTELELNLTTYLPNIHPRDLFLDLFTDATCTKLRRVVRLENGGVSDSTGALLPLNGAALTEICGAEEPRVSVVLALTSRESILGIIGFHALDEYFDYLLMRDHVASALQVVHLHDEVLRQTMVSERNAQERQAAAERSNALAALAGGVAHDLNNALGSLVALTDVVYDEVEACIDRGEPLGGEVKGDLLMMKSGALRAAETIKDLMTLGRISRTHHEPFDVGHVANRVVAEVREGAPARLGKHVKLDCEGPSDSLVVIGSAPHIERAIGNLLRNAVDAVSEGGQITVTVAAQNLLEGAQGYESIPAGAYAVITVVDHGAGIEPAQLRRVFEPFFSTKRLGDTSGSGLGLAIVFSVAKEHHGYVDVSSAPGLGSRFSLYLPRVSGSPEARHSSGPWSFGTAKILVVDDDLTQLRTARRVLTRLGYDVITTASGAHAIDIVKAEAHAPNAAFLDGASPTRGFDLVIMDLALNEDEDGLTVIRRIRELFPGQRAILASGHAFLDHEQQIHEAGLVWLPKPYTVQALSEAIRQSLRHGDGMSDLSHAT